MMQHTIATDHEMIEAILNGAKTARMKVDDNGYQPGDYILFAEFDDKGNYLDLIGRTVVSVKRNEIYIEPDLCIIEVQ